VGSPKMKKVPMPNWTPSGILRAAEERMEMAVGVRAWRKTERDVLYDGGGSMGPIWSDHFFMVARYPVSTQLSAK
jgi:hypothetical protein